MIPVREVDKTRKSSQPTGQHPYAIREQLIIGGVVDPLSTGVASILTFSPFSKPCSQAQSTSAALMARQVEWRMRERFSARVERAGVW